MHFKRVTNLEYFDLYFTGSLPAAGERSSRVKGEGKVIPSFSIGRLSRPGPFVECYQYHSMVQSYISLISHISQCMQRSEVPGYSTTTTKVQ